MRKLLKRSLLRLMALIFGDAGQKVIYYHDLGTSYTKMGTPLDLFKSHVRMARTHGYTFVSDLKTIGCDKEEYKRLLICFDDAFRGIYDARDYFRDEGLCPVVFVPVGLVGTPGHLTWGEMAELQELGFSFQSHTWSHQTLAGAGIEALAGKSIDRSDAWYEHELCDSRAEIISRLGKSVTALCFPAGKFSKEILRRCLAAGYTELYTSIPGNMRDFGCTFKSDGCKLVPRHLCQDLSTGEFLDVIRGGMRFFKRHYLRQHLEE